MTTEMNSVKEHFIKTTCNIHEYLCETSFIKKFSNTVKVAYLESDPSDTSKFENEGEYLKISNTTKKVIDNVDAFMEHNGAKIIAGRIVLNKYGLSEEDLQDAYEFWEKETKKLFDGDYACAFNYFCEKHDIDLFKTD